MNTPIKPKSIFQCQAEIYWFAHFTCFSIAALILVLKLFQYFLPNCIQWEVTELCSM